MPYAFVLSGFAIFTLVAGIATLLTRVHGRLRYAFAFAWRMWLWASIGFVACNALLAATLMYFLTGAGIATGPPQRAGVMSWLPGLAVSLGPFVASALGVVLGLGLGFSLTQRKMGRARDSASVAAADRPTATVGR